MGCQNTTTHNSRYTEALPVVVVFLSLLFICCLLFYGCKTEGKYIMKKNSDAKEQKHFPNNSRYSAEVSSDDADVEKKFRALMLQWHDYMKQPPIVFCSNPETLISCEPYHDIVQLGKSALPFIVADMKKGQFLLWYAVRDITGVNLVPEGKYLNGNLLSEQDIAQMYLHWWETEGVYKFTNDENLKK